MSSRFWETLLQYIDNQQVIPIVGSELLKTRVGDRKEPLLLHRYIAECLARELDVVSGKLTAKETLNSIICRYLEKHGSFREDVYPTINRILLAKAPTLTVPEPLLKLARIRHFKLFITTSFDPLLEMAVREVRPQEKLSVYAYSPHAPEDLPRELHEMEGTAVYYLLGKVSSSPDYAITEEDTLEFFYSMQGDKRTARLFDELRERHLLVIGSSFPDWLARFFIRIAKGGRLSLQREAAALQIIADELALADKNLVLFLEHFSYRTEIFKEGGASHFVDELWRRYSERHPGEDSSAALPPPSALQKDSSQAPQTVFISYAREDAAAAKLVYAELDDVGWTVWFDEKALGAGDKFSAKIKENIQSCSIFMPIVSAQTQRRTEGYFRREWSYAVERAQGIEGSQVFICPLALDETPATSDAKVPDEFLAPNWIRLPGGKLTKEFRDAMKELLRARRKRKE